MTDTSNNKEQKIPSNKPWVSGLIFSILLVIAFLIGGAAGPMISEWMAAQPEMPETEMQAHDHGAESAGSVVNDEWFVCPMHPWVVQQGQGTCPICTMDLTPLDPARFSGEISIDPVVVQNIGIRVEQVQLGAISSGFESIGTIETDESSVTDLTVRFDGWVDDVHVNEAGEFIAAGEPVLDIYSPALEAAQREVLVLLDNGYGIDSSLVTAARNKLRNLNMPEAAIETLFAEKEVIRTITVTAPASGYISKKAVETGQQIRAGQTAVQITDLSEVWAIVTVYEHQLPRVREGQAVTIRQEYETGVTASGNVDHIYPTVDASTRQVEVRIVVDNSNRQFKPGMYVRAAFSRIDGDTAVITAPREAVIHSGRRQLVFVSKGNGQFEPRTVETGREAGNGYVEITSGLEFGEYVVVSGQFLLDSESRIRESLLKMVEGSSATDQRPVLEMRAASNRAEWDSAATEPLDAFLELFTIVQTRLYNGQLPEAQESIPNLVSAFQRLQLNGHIPAEANSHAEDARSALGRLEQASSLESARKAFAFLGDAVNEILLITGLPGPLQADYMGVQCGMYPDTPNMGVWIQTVGDIENPFYGAGSAMATCSTDSWAFPATGEEVEQKQQNQQAESRATPRPQPETAGNEELAELFESYFAIHDALYNDDLGGAVSAATEMLARLEDAPDLSEIMKPGLEALAAANALKSARIAFGQLSEAMDNYFRSEGLPAGVGGNLVTKVCGMYPGVPRDGVWIQIAGETKNPFFGKDHFMAACAPEESPLPTDSGGRK